MVFIPVGMITGQSIKVLHRFPLLISDTTGTFTVDRVSGATV